MRVHEAIIIFAVILTEFIVLMKRIDKVEDSIAGVVVKSYCVGCEDGADMVVGLHTNMLNRIRDQKGDK